MANEPQGIQQQRREIQIGEEKDSIKREPQKGKGVEAKSVKEAARIIGVTTVTIYRWRKVYGCGLLIKDLREIQERFRLREISKFHSYHKSPSRWKKWIIEEYRADQLAFFDWGVLWKEELTKRSGRHIWHKTPESKRKDKAIRAREARKLKFKNDPEAYQKHKDYTNQRRRQKIKATPSLRLLCSLRSRLYKYHKGKNSATIRSLIGCTRDQLKRHLESKFKRGMTWDNYGTFWHIDHIIPCKAFDHANLAQIKMCWHWTNLQPLEAVANCTKGATIENGQTSLLFKIAS